MKKEKNTEELNQLLHRVKNEKELKRFVNQLATLPSFCDFLENWIWQTGQEKAEVVQKSGLQRNYAYQILSGMKKPGRDKAIALCLAAQMNVEQVNHALQYIGATPLYSKARRDAAILFAFQKKIDVMQLNELLIELGEARLE